MNNNPEIVKPPKTGEYGFKWRIISEDNTFQLQRYSCQYTGWISVKTSFNKDEIVKMYERLKPYKTINR